MAQSCLVLGKLQFFFFEGICQLPHLYFRLIKLALNSLELQVRVYQLFLQFCSFENVLFGAFTFQSRMLIQHCELLL